MVGFYDTGIGGKAVIDEVLQLDPTFKYRFFVDSEALPLGSKSSEYIRDHVMAACESLFSQGCKLIILACNTASVHTIRYIQQKWLPENYPDRQVLGVTTPLLEYSDLQFSHVKQTPGILLATPATCKHPYYHEEFYRHGFTTMTDLPAEGLANAIENRNVNEIQSILLTLRQSLHISPGYIILACTHYTHAKEQLKDVFPNAEIIDPTKFIAQRILDYIKKHPEYL